MNIENKLSKVSQDKKYVIINNILWCRTDNKKISWLGINGFEHHCQNKKEIVHNYTTNVVGKNPEGKCWFCGKNYAKCKLLKAAQVLEFYKKKGYLK